MDNSRTIKLHGESFACCDGCEFLVSNKAHRDILLISPSVIERDPRVLAHLEVLGEFGRVTSVGYGKIPPGSSNHLEIPESSSYLPRTAFGLIQIVLRRYQQASRSTRFSCAVKSAIGTSVFDLVVVNDVHTLTLGRDLADQMKVPLWVDMHEYAPREGEDDWKWRLFLESYVKRLCSQYLSTADLVTTVSEGIRVQYEKDTGREVVLLRNTVRYKSNENQNRLRSRSELRLVHVGVAIRSRQLENMILAVQGLEGVTLDLLLLPTDQKYFETLKSLVSRMTNVRICSPVPTEQIVETIESYDCGLVTIPPSNFNYANGLPNKLFQYIQARLAIISGPIPEVAEIVENYRIGWVTESFAAESIRKTISLAREADKSLLVPRLEAAARELSREKEHDIRRTSINRLIPPLNQRMEKT